MMGILDSKTIIVTGGSLGIGRAVAEECLREGARVIIVARNEVSLAQTLAELNRKSGKVNFSYSLDVGDLQSVIKFAAWVGSNFGTVQGLVNCAGVYGPVGALTKISMEEFTSAIQVNFLGTVYMCHAILPVLSSEKRKKIVNFSGGGAASPFPNYSAYATSKIALVRFTENLALELAGDNCDVNCVAPGFVITRLHQQTLDAGPEKAGASFYENTKKQIGNGGVPASKAAELTAFLLSEASDGITGKFVSAPWDQWQDKQFQERLRTDKDFATLRRIDDKGFFKKT